MLRKFDFNLIQKWWKFYRNSLNLETEQIFHSILLHICNLHLFLVYFLYINFIRIKFSASFVPISQGYTPNHKECTLGLKFLFTTSFLKIYYRYRYLKWIYFIQLSTRRGEVKILRRWKNQTDKIKNKSDSCGYSYM